MNVSRGAFIVFEGMDRTGKTTQCKKLVESLRSKQLKAEYTNFPNRNTEIGKVINNYLTMKNDLPDAGIHLLFSANRWEKISHIQKMLEAGITVITDRYCFSGVAFSAAKGMDLEWCKSSDKGLLKPDKVFFLTLPVEAIVDRNQFGNERYEVLDFQKKVYDVYTQLKDSSWDTIEANRSIEVIGEDILNRTLNVINSIGNLPIDKIWMD